MKAYRNWILGVAGVLSLSAAVAFAADDDSADARALRLSTVEGQVQVAQDGQLIADTATANLPLFEGSQITTGNDGRAEVQFEDGGVVRLSPNTTLTFTVLQQEGSDTKTEMVLNGGLAYFELQPSTGDHRVRVSYGTATFSPSSFAVVRLNMDAVPGSLAVFSGDVHLERSHGVKLDIHGGESVTLDATDAHRYQLSETIETDSWDSWNADRDQALNQQSTDQTEAQSYVNNQPAGMSDLDANGNWYNVPGQGLVWSPYVALTGGSSWDPYGYGRWVYYPRYGYVWSSGYSWGYAPFQCGTWNFFDSFGWGWAPGYGCNPWYAGGGWGYNIGSYPRGYHPPRRPDSGPIRGHGGPRPVGPGGEGGGSGARRIAVAPIPVDRRVPGSPSNGVVTGIRGGSVQPVTVGGRVLQPLRPVAPRQTYAGSIANGGASNPGSGFGTRPVGRAPLSPGYNPNGGYNPRGNYGGSVGANPGQPGIRSAPQPIYRPAPSGGGGGGSRPMQPMPSRPAPSFGGGGGGGGGHPMGGGGGMGGGAHPSGGGGSPHK